MAQNRTLPYGYKIENGKLIAEPQEVKTVEQIYERYARGESYKKIAEWLTLSGVRYMPHKAQWNKNMVARILQNKNYLGTKKLPSHIGNRITTSSRGTDKAIYPHRKRRH